MQILVSLLDCDSGGEPPVITSPFSARPSPESLYSSVATRATLLRGRRLGKSQQMTQKQVAQKRQIKLFGKSFLLWTTLEQTAMTFDKDRIRSFAVRSLRCSGARSKPLAWPGPSARPTLQKRRTLGRRGRPDALPPSAKVMFIPQKGVNITLE
jgi:hypothetical protein